MPKAQPEQEPVAWMYTSQWKGDERFITRYQTELTTYKADKVWPLYTAPPQRERIMCGCGDQIMPDDGAECGTCVTARNATQREWQGLTDEEIYEEVVAVCDDGQPPTWEEFFDEDAAVVHKLVRAIEAKLREKNT